MVVACGDATGVDSVQAQGMVSCRAGIVEVDGDRDRRVIRSGPRQRQQDARGTSGVYAKIEARRNI